jgi:2-oxoisovalerate dehydrogenase E1 component alpha subunit
MGSEDQDPPSGPWRPERRRRELGGPLRGAGRGNRAAGRGDAAELNPSGGTDATAPLPASLCLQIYRLLVRARVLEERLIRMCLSGEGYLWAGGAGQEAFDACLGLQVKKGRGPAFDYLHLHYRSTATLLAMGMPPADAVRQMAMTATDRHSRGRSFCGHFACRAWNVLPVASPVGVQYARAPGTALVQRRQGGDGITIVTGGDAGTAQGDFASCLVWSTRPGQELPVLMVVSNNGWGISTPACSQHGERHIIDRGRAFGIPGEVVDGNDPVASWQAIARAMAYCRHERRPYLLEARVSRLYGHSSASGARRVMGEPDCVRLFERRLRGAGVLGAGAIADVYAGACAEIEAAVEQVRAEPQPAARDVYRDSYAASRVDAVYPGDYSGLPGEREAPPAHR